MTGDGLGAVGVLSVCVLGAGLAGTVIRGVPGTMLLSCRYGAEATVLPDAVIWHRR